jgi:hypothetical protein
LARQQLELAHSVAWLESEVVHLVHFGQLEVPGLMLAQWGLAVASLEQGRSSCTQTRPKGTRLQRELFVD